MIRPVATPPATVAEAFRRSEQQVVLASAQLLGDPKAAADQASVSAAAQAAFRGEVVALPAFAREQSGRLALQALAAGLFCGAMDGVILMEVGRLPEAGAPTPPPPALARPFEQFDRALDQGRTVARDTWAGLGADELQLLSGYGKHQNEATVQEAEALAERASLPEAQEFLLGTFKAGYALGLVDAVLVCRTGETPGQAKEA